LLMSHLHATFRSLATANLPVHELVKRANRIFCEGTLTTHFATLICGKANRNGEVEICNSEEYPIYWIAARSFL
ncbi:MAG: SpoIIE family protein phosphatase, partial [Bacteroidota bacterium]